MNVHNSSKRIYVDDEADDSPTYEEEYNRFLMFHGGENITKCRNIGPEWIKKYPHSFIASRLQIKDIGQYLDKNRTLKRHIDKIEVAEIFLARGANPNLDSGYCINKSCEMDRGDILQLLITYGAEVGIDHILYCCQNNKPKCLKVLLLDRNQVNCYSGMELATQMDYLDIMNVFISLGADYRNNNNYLIWVAKCYQSEKVLQLLSGE